MNDKCIGTKNVINHHCRHHCHYHFYTYTWKMCNIVLTFQSYRWSLFWICSKVLTATMGYSFSSCSENLSCFINGFLYLFTIIFKYRTLCEIRSFLFHVFHGSFPALHGSFSSVIIMLKIQVVIGTNMKQKIRAASCITGGQRIQPLISQLLLLLYLHKEKLSTHHKELTFYFQRRNSKK